MPSSLLLCFVGFISVCVSANVTIDPSILHDIFDYQAPAAAAPPAAAHSQAAPVTPAPDSESQANVEYWENTDYYNPAPIDYDKFDWILTKQIAVSTNDNFLLSPLGLKLALAILTEAATGVTQSELASVLGFEKDLTAVRKKFSSIIESLKKESSEYILNLGSRIYIGDSAAPRQRFAAIAEEFYKTQVKAVNFNKPSEAVQEINAWVSNITRGKISNVVDQDDIANIAVLVLNTLYFKGSWRHQFAPNMTKPRQFYVSPTVLKQVPFMNVNDKFYYTESTKFDAKVLRMPYLGNKFAMYIAVPNSLTGLPRVLENLNVLRSELDELEEHYVDISIPKFTFDYTSQLGGILKDLGVREAFEDTASFPGIARGENVHEKLKISKVLQRTGIDVNEYGSVAYAVTEISLVNKFGEDVGSQVEVIADRPFLFFIEDEATRQLLFTGRVSNPGLQDGGFKLP